jgi:hypothetical protein
MINEFDKLYLRALREAAKTRGKRLMGFQPEHIERSNRRREIYGEAIGKREQAVREFMDMNSHFRQALVVNARMQRRRKSEIPREIMMSVFTISPYGHHQHVGWAENISQAKALAEYHLRLSPKPMIKTVQVTTARASRPAGSSHPRENRVLATYELRDGKVQEVPRATA